MAAAQPAGEKPVLVLNLANPVNPGGGVRRGAHAQEEDLCRKSSLLMSLESEAAKLYYQYNSSLNTYMGSDAIILNPTVDIIKDENGDLLDQPVTVSVLTSAAPMISLGLEGMTKGEYYEMFLRRIRVTLQCAAAWGYKELVLGAWGCGAFANDGREVAGMFAQVLHEMEAAWPFRRVDFAILSRSGNGNYNIFRRELKDFLTENV